MKKISILSIVILVVFGSFFSCQPKDDKAPNIFFSSDVETSQDWVLQEYYELPPATASDNVDGNVTDKISLSNDLVFYELRTDSIAGQTVYKCENKIKNGTKGFVGKTGKYAIVYSATDEAGNKGSRTLSINVLNSLNDWSLNASGVKINYLIKRECLGSSCNQYKIGGVYKEGVQYPTYDITGIDGKPVTTTFSTDRAINYRLKISKIGNIGGLAIYVDFNRYSRVIDFIDVESGVIQEDGVDYVYDVSISKIAGAENFYNVENKSFTITYLITRFYEDTNGDKEVDGRHWSFDRLQTYKETYVPE